MGLLDGKVAIVTGAGHGIGQLGHAPHDRGALVLGELDDHRFRHGHPTNLRLVAMVG